MHLHTYVHSTNEHVYNDRGTSIRRAGVCISTPHTRKSCARIHVRVEEEKFAEIVKDGGVSRNMLKRSCDMITLNLQRSKSRGAFLRLSQRLFEPSAQNRQGAAAAAAAAAAGANLVRGDSNLWNQPSSAGTGAGTGSGGGRAVLTVGRPRALASDFAQLNPSIALLSARCDAPGGAFVVPLKYACVCCVGRGDACRIQHV